MWPTIELRATAEEEFTLPKLKFPLNPGWKNTFAILALGIWAMVTVACSYPISSLVRAEADPTLTLPKVLENPKGYMGSVVIWGGVVSKVSSEAGGSRLLVKQSSLDPKGHPQTRIIEGEFIARSFEPLDPQVYRSGLVITLAGEIESVEEKNLEYMEYPRPVLRIIEVHPWKEKALPLTHGIWEGEFHFPSSPFEEPPSRSEIENKPDETIP